MALSAKQARFVEEYLVDLNATEAAKRAGYSPGSAHVQGHRLLSDDKIQAELKRRQQARQERTEITQDRVLQGLAAVAFGDMRKLFDENGELIQIADLPDDAAAMLAGADIVTVEKGEGAVEHVAKIRTNDRMRAFEMLGRHLGMFNDKLDVNMTGDLSTRLQKARQRDNGSE